LVARLFQNCFEPAVCDRDEKISCGIHSFADCPLPIVSLAQAVVKTSCGLQSRMS
jgi:hypothetical protein